MTGPRIIDAVTLRHFGCIERMSILALRTQDRPLPRWVDAVKEEIWNCMGLPECDAVLSSGFLGQPYEIPLAEFRSVYELQVALNDLQEPAGIKHRGEAESIHAADVLGGDFVTDDNDAYDVAVGHLGPARVFDTVDLLREAVARGELGSSEAQHVADAIRNSGRHLRYVHPATLTAADFERDASS